MSADGKPTGGPPAKPSGGDSAGAGAKRGSGSSRRRRGRRRRPAGQGEQGGQGGQGGLGGQGGQGGQGPRSGEGKPPGSGEGKGSGRSRRRRRRRRPAGGEGSSQQGSQEQRTQGRQGEGGQAAAGDRKKRPPRGGGAGRRRRHRRGGRQGEGRGGAPEGQERAAANDGRRKPQPAPPPPRERRPRPTAPADEALDGAVGFPDEAGWGVVEDEDETPAPLPVKAAPTEPEMSVDEAVLYSHPALDDEAPAAGRLAGLVPVRFRDHSRVVDYDAGDLVIHVGNQLVVETDQGLMVGTAARDAQRQMCTRQMPRVIRKVDANDLKQIARNVTREQEAHEFCQERAAQRGLPMKLIRVEYLHGGNKAIFFFASETRVDFRDLVRDLAQRLHTRIVMRQVGVRDEARMTGGIGSCGCELCCSSCLPKFEPVSIRMAKDQGIVLNPQKVSGQCGRLKCCLVYELDQYVQCRRSLPRAGKRVVTPDGEGRVQELDILRKLVRVVHSDGLVKTYPSTDVRLASASASANRPNNR